MDVILENGCDIQSDHFATVACLPKRALFRVVFDFKEKKKKFIKTYYRRTTCKNNAEFLTAMGIFVND